MVSCYRFRGNTMEQGTVPTVLRNLCHHYRSITAAAVGSSIAGNPWYSRRRHYRSAL